MNDDTEAKIMDKIGQEIKKSITNGKGKILIKPIDKEKRQEATTNTTAIDGSNIQGCQKSITNKVKSGIVPLYIFLFVSLIIYVVIFGSSFIYWLDLRNEKEYNEFN